MLNKTKRTPGTLGKITGKSITDIKMFSIVPNVEIAILVWL